MCRKQLSKEKARLVGMLFNYEEMRNVYKWEGTDALDVVKEYIR